jgi:RNA-dependent RNA polymerase
MTDGNGLISGSLMRALALKYKWEETPATIQMRLAGFKGTLTLSSTESFRSPFSVTFRDSQRKIQLSLDQPWQRVLHVVAPSTVTQPAHLSAQYLRVLSHGGVSNGTVHRYLQAALVEEVEKLTVFDTSPVGRARLYSAVMRAGGVQASRLRRITGGASRAMGYGRDREDNENDEDDVSFESSQSSSSSTDAWSRDEISGFPTSKEEILMLAILSGFDILRNHYFSEKWRDVIRKVIQSFILKFRIPVPKSASAFVIPGACSIEHAFSF